MHGSSLAEGDAPPAAVLPPTPSRENTGRGIAEWLAERLIEDAPTLVEIDRGFPFPICYFDKYGLKHEWPIFLDDFHRHWPTDDDYTYVDFVRDGAAGNGAAHRGNAPWRRLTEERAGGASLNRSSFSTCRDRSRINPCGDSLAALYPPASPRSRAFLVSMGGHSAVAEVYPALRSRNFAHKDRTSGQHGAFSIDAWLSRADQDGSVANFLKRDLTPPECALAQVEGWILGCVMLGRSRSLVAMALRQGPFP